MVQAWLDEHPERKRMELPPFKIYEKARKLRLRKAAGVTRRPQPRLEDWSKAQPSLTNGASRPLGDSPKSQPQE